jgi:hypothetical protein
LAYFSTKDIYFCFSGNKKTVFLVNSVPLVTQQKEYLARNLDLTCKSFCGDDGVDDWNQEKWTQELENIQVGIIIVVL